MAQKASKIHDRLANTQRMILESLRTAQKTPSYSPDPVLFETDPAKLNSLGPAGSIVARFANSVNAQHPDVADFTADSEWDYFSKFVDTGCPMANDFKTILNRLNVIKPRLLRDPLRRSEVQTIKSNVKHVGLKHVYMMGENGFYSRPDGFEVFVRGNDSCVPEMEKLIANYKTFSDNNMPEVANAVKKRIKTLEDMRSESVLGFHRMKPQDAAMVVARMLDLDWNEMHFVTVPFDFFEEAYWPEITDRRDEERQRDEMKKLLVMRDRKMALADSVAFTYQPRLYPLAKFVPPPKSVTDVIAAVESLPDLNGCPAFDYYWVLVPSININHPYFRHKDVWKVRVREASGDLVLRSFQDEYEAALALDKTLVSDGYFPPVVLGERDGKCLFLSLWLT